MREQGQPDATGALFRSTHWSVVARASDADPAVRHAALTSLLSVYVPALSTYIRWHRRIPPDQLDDLLQGFVCDKVVADELFACADPARGQFRLFVLKSLERYIRRVHRHETAAKRSPAGGLLSLEGEDIADAPSSEEPAGASFDLAWARQVIQQAMRRMCEDCRKAGRDGLWALFEERVIKPSFEDTATVGYDELVQRLGLASAAEAANRLVTAKRLFARHLRAVIGEYTTGEGNVDEELRHLWDVFSRHKSPPRP
jgi:hypothetical protein